jgi:hypothetical protein
MSMPSYKLRYQLKGAKINRISYDLDKAIQQKRESNGSATLHFEDKGVKPEKITKKELNTIKPKVGMYFMKQDGRVGVMDEKSFNNMYMKDAPIKEV